MIGSIIGDIIGSVYEWKRIKTVDFPLFQSYSDFTDDSVMTFATAYAILQGKPYGECYRDFGRRYINRGYGGMFHQWIDTDDAPAYGSYGNGAAMRVGPIGYAFDTPKSVIEEAEKTAAVTHNHVEGIKGAQATALAIYLCRKKYPKEKIRKVISTYFKYNLDRTVESIRPTYHFDESCQGTVPEAIIAFLDSTSFEDAIRLAVSLGGDSDTLACITGGIAEAYYESIPREIARETLKRLPKEFIQIITGFHTIYGIKVVCP